MVSNLLKNIRKLNSSINPKIIVTTNVHSNSVYNFFYYILLVKVMYLLHFLENIIEKYN